MDLNRSRHCDKLTMSGRYISARSPRAATGRWGIKTTLLFKICISIKNIKQKISVREKGGSRV
jgi:hypothetical protein